MGLTAIFLGINDAGQKVYEWLCDREDVEVKAMLTEKEQLSLIEEIEPEIVISSGFEHKVPEKIIKIPEKGIVNLHPSYLPYNRGSHPYIWPIIDGTPAGVSIHYMNNKIDHGDIIAKREVEVRPDDTAQTLYERLQNEQATLFKERWPNIVKSKIEPEKQQSSNGNTNYKKDLDEILELDLNKEVEVREFIDKLRALTFPPHQTAYFERYGKKYFVELNIVSEEERK